jgi:hypothetical protein
MALLGLLYMAFRCRSELRERWRGSLQLALVPVLFAAGLVAWEVFAAGFHERYFRPALPLVLVFAAFGYRKMGEDLRWGRLAWGLGALAVVICLVATLRRPIRAHRRQQTRAGHWLAEHDPHYEGVVLSTYPQPVYHAGMDYMPVDAMWRGWYARHFGGRAAVKYFILEDKGLEERTWAHDYVRERGWPVIFHGEARGIRIYRNPAFDADRQAQPAGADAQNNSAERQSQ